MDNCDTPSLVRQLADRYSLRYLDQSRHYLGIHEGLCIDVFEFRRDIYLHVFSPTAVINEQVMESFNGFSHMRELGVPTEWIAGCVTASGADPRACSLELSQYRLRQLSLEQFLAIPDSLARDFRLFGGAAVIDSCDHCGANGRMNLMYVQGVYQIACDACLMNLRAQSPQGVLEHPTTVRWLPAAGAILLASCIFSLLWGLLQQPKEMSGELLLIAPFLGAIAMARFVAKSAGGTSMALRFGTLTGTLIATLLGNIWGFRTAVAAQQNVLLPWSDAADLYFNHQLRVNSGVEGIYLLGAAAGAWVGTDILRSMGLLKFE